jgi:formylmethanofuran dehydrogenase subunit E
MHTGILGHTFDEYREIVKKFHGAAAPGVIIGGFMVDTAIWALPDGILYDAICETQSCLPDAIQLLTPCTVGNGWLKIIPLGLFALTLYSKETLEGVRVFLDIEKVEAWPEIKTWYLKLKSKQEQALEDVVEEIRWAGSSIVSLRPVRVRPDVAARTHKGSIGVCPRCGQAYPSDDGPVCLLCRGEYALYDMSGEEGPQRREDAPLALYIG